MRGVAEGLEAGLSITQWLEVAERAYLALVLVREQGNQCAAARVAGCHRNTLARRLEHFGIDVRKVYPRHVKPHK